nr:excinuclease ABC subunit A [Candidatus Latescibacterota bacterium]
MPTDQLVIRGARQHNLQNVDLTLPKDSLIVFTGVSGSGKSSLAFDTVYAEGQRRYIESLSSYARQFLDQTPKPEVDSIDGLAPTISIEQKGTGHNPRSTVGTVTEIYDYLRVFFAAIGTPHCPQCQQPIGAQTPDQITARLLDLPAGARLHLLAPVAQARKGEYRDLFDDMRKIGYIRARVDGQYTDLTADLELDRHRRHDVDIVIDRGTIGRPGFSDNDRTRLAEGVEAALGLGEGSLIAAWEAGDKSQDLLLSAQYACGECGTSFTPPSHATFSFNSPQGMCPACDGLGTQIEFVPELLIQHPEKSLRQGAIPTMLSLRNSWRRAQFDGVAKHYGFKLNTPVKNLDKRQLHHLLGVSRKISTPHQVGVGSMWTNHLGKAGHRTHRRSNAAIALWV